MENYTLGLALFDYLPVFAGGIGLYLVCRYCAAQAGYSSSWVVAIPLIALIGGAMKATWKTIWVVAGINLQWMSDQLFFFLVTAYLLMTVFVIRTLSAARNGVSLSDDWWVLPLIIVTAVLGSAFYLKATSDGRGWSIVLIATLALASLVFLLTLIRHAYVAGDRIAMLLFATNLILSYVLVGLARLEQTAELQWIEEILNFVNNSLLALAAWRLTRRAAQHA